MLKRIDQSKFIAKLLTQLSDLLAKNKGLPIIIGIALVALSMFIQGIDVYAGSKTLQLIGVITHNLGVLIALIGLLLSNPMGK